MTVTPKLASGENISALCVDRSVLSDPDSEGALQGCPPANTTDRCGTADVQNGTMNLFTVDYIPCNIPRVYLYPFTTWVGARLIAVTTAGNVIKTLVSCNYNNFVTNGSALDVSPGYS